MDRVKTPQGPATAGAEPMTFVKARRVRSFDDVVDQVRSAIMDGTIGAGERLPSERELAEQFGVSRATLREALRALEAFGLIEIRVGAHGGAFATDSTAERSVDALRQVYDLELASRPREARRFRASLHADNAIWSGRAPETLALLSTAIVEGPRAFLLTLAESSGVPLRAALAAAVEAEDGRGSPSTLSTGEMELVVDLLRQDRPEECRRHLFTALTDPGERGPR